MAGYDQAVYDTMESGSERGGDRRAREIATAFAPRPNLWLTC